MPKPAIILFRLLLGLGPLAVAGAPIRPPVEAQAIGIIQTEPAEFPRELARIGVMEGWAKVAVAVDDEGRLTDALVLGHSHLRFAEAALAALQQWRFEPARVNGEAVTTVSQLDFRFRHDAHGARIVSFSAMDFSEQLAAKAQADMNLLVAFEALDCLPIPIHMVAPHYSAEPGRDQAVRKVEVSFYIDDTGKVRLPTLVYADDIGIAREALAAVAQWRFMPPQYRNRTVITKASQTFEFRGPRS